MQKTKLLFTILLMLLMAPPFALAVNPQPSKICATLLLAHRALDIAGRAPQIYTLNSLVAFRNTLGPGVEVNPDIYSGMSWYQPGTEHVEGSFSRDDVLAELDGIAKFAATSDAAVDGQVQITKAITLRGQSNINYFLADLETQVYSLGPHERLTENSTRFAPIALSIVGGLLMYFNYLDVSFIDWTSFAFFGQAVSHTPQALRRLVSAVNGLPRFLQTLKNINSQAGQGGWALISQNAKLDPQLVKAFETGNLDDAHIDNYLADQVINDNKQRSWFSRTPPTQFVAVDILLDARKDEPELHLILRETKNRPLFPKRPKEKSKISIPQWSLTPGLQTQPIKIDP